MPRPVGPGSCIVPDWADPLAIDDRCWWRYTGTVFVLEILPAYRNMNDAAEARADEVFGRARKITEEIGKSFGLPDGTRLALDETPLIRARCSCYRDDVRDPNCRVHGTAAKASTVGRSSARERSTVGLYWEGDR